MSPSVPSPCGRLSLLLLLAPLLAAGHMTNCSHPLVPEHGGFRCDPSPCRGFHHRSTIHLFCEPGYHIPNRLRLARCRHGNWEPPLPACVPVRGSNVRQEEERPADSMPSMATTAVGVSIFLLTTTACLVVKSRLFTCQSHSRRSSDQLDLMVDGLPVPLPSYEEAVYGSWGQRLPACSVPGPTQLLLAQEGSTCPSSSSANTSSTSTSTSTSSSSSTSSTSINMDQVDQSLRPLLSGPCPDTPPPPYQEVPTAHPRERVRDRVTEEKDT